jgi:ankyrin repeat protein
MLSNKKRDIRFFNLLLASLMLFLIPNPGHTDDMAKELLEAAESGNINSLEGLISKGADVNSTDSSGNTPLLMAAKFGHIEYAKTLLNIGADINTDN